MFRLENLLPSTTAANLSSISSVVFYFLLTITLSCFFRMLRNYKKTILSQDDARGPYCWPVVGYAPKLATKNSEDILDTLYELQKEYNGFLKIWFGPKLIYFVSKPEHCEKVLNNPKSMDKDYLYKFVNNVTGPGLMTAKGAHWKKHRKAIMPAFNQKILESFVEIFAEQSRILTQQLDKTVGDRSIDLLEYVSKCTLDIVCETALGVKMHQQTKESDFASNFERLADIVQRRIFHPWYHLDFLFYLFPLGWEYRKRLKIFQDFTSEVVKAKMEAHQEKLRLKNSQSYIEEEEIGKKMAFLDLILDNANFTFDELVSEVKIFIIGGTDTSAVTLCSILMLMGMHPEIQQEVHDEVLEVVGPDRDILPSDLPRLKYTERVVKEGSRLFPVGAYFIRQLGDNIDIGDTVLPAGSSVFFNAVYINRNPVYWPDPLKFDPDRFLPENVEKRHPCTFISFSNGPRNCIGARYAVLSLKVMLATILRKFVVHCDYKEIKDIRLKANIVLRHRDGCKVWFERRK